MRNKLWIFSKLTPLPYFNFSIKVRIFFSFVKIFLHYFTIKSRYPPQVNQQPECDGYTSPLREPLAPMMALIQLVPLFTAVL